jgi:hypothetical protein
MPERSISMNRVGVSASFPFSRQVSGLAQFGDDPLNSTLGDSNLLGDVTSPNGMVLMDADHHMGMVGQEGPRSFVPLWGVGLSYHGVTGVQKKESGASASHARTLSHIAHYHQSATRHVGRE